MSIKEITKSKSKKVLYYLAGKFFYISGLTILIPFVFLLSLPEEAATTLSSSWFLISVAGIITGVGIYFFHKLYPTDPGKLCKRLGISTLIPGIVGVLLLMTSQETIVFWIDQIIPVIDNAERIDFLLTLYVHYVVPSVTSMTIAYLFLGISLYFYGRQIQKK